MTMNFRTRTRTTSRCAHENRMRIEVAGMSREVCETCGKVSLAFVDDTYSDWSDEGADEPSVETSEATEAG